MPHLLSEVGKEDVAWSGRRDQERCGQQPLGWTSHAWRLQLPGGLEVGRARLEKGQRLQKEGDSRVDGWRVQAGEGLGESLREKAAIGPRPGGPSECQGRAPGVDAD